MRLVVVTQIQHPTRPQPPILSVRRKHQAPSRIDRCHTLSRRTSRPPPTTRTLHQHTPETINNKTHAGTLTNVTIGVAYAIDRIRVAVAVIHIISRVGVVTVANSTVRDAVAVHAVNPLDTTDVIAVVANVDVVQNGRLASVGVVENGASAVDIVHNLSPLGIVAVVNSNTVTAVVGGTVHDTARRCRRADRQPGRRFGRA